MLKKVQKGQPAATFRKLCREEFATVFGFLSGSATVKRQEDRIKLIWIHPLHVPASIKVMWTPLGGDKTPVDVHPATSSGMQGYQRRP
jgi:hypothetical protein